MNVKVKRLSWGGNYAYNALCKYGVEYTSEGRYKVHSPTFGWYPDKEYNNKKAATEACQRHWTQQVLDLLEVSDEI